MRINNNDTILAVGSIAIDALETPNGNRENVLGGSATYFSIAASLFAPIKIVGVVGTDFPEFGWQVFRSKNINSENPNWKHFIILRLHKYVFTKLKLFAIDKMKQLLPRDKLRLRVGAGSAGGGHHRGLGLRDRRIL